MKGASWPFIFNTSKNGARPSTIFARIGVYEMRGERVIFEQSSESSQVVMRNSKIT